jgi:hypothetical protein
MIRTQLVKRCNLHDASFLIGVHRRLKIFLRHLSGILGDACAPPMSDAMMRAKVSVKPGHDVWPELPAGEQFENCSILLALQPTPRTATPGVRF